MKTPIFISFLFCIQTFAQTNNNLKIIEHDANNFTQDETKFWIINNSKSKFADVPQLTYLAKKIDTADYKKDGQGYKFYKPRFYFGLRNSDKIYELPIDFYANKSNEFRENPIAFYKDRFL